MRLVLVAVIFAMSATVQAKEEKPCPYRSGLRIAGGVTKQVALAKARAAGKGVTKGVK